MVPFKALFDSLHRSSSTKDSLNAHRQAFDRNQGATTSRMRMRSLRYLPASTFF
jgi:hypothetical protein